MRVSDAERNEITNALCRHFADGRLDEEEFNQRSAQATAAKTQADLGPLLADLPPLDEQSPAPGPSRPRSDRRMLPVIVGILVLVVASSTLGAVGGLFHHSLFFFHPHIPWVLVAIVAFVVLRRSRWRRRDHGRV